MATRTEEVEKAERSIKNAEIKLNTIKTQLDSVEKDIFNLEWTEESLKENLNYLKQKKIIPLAIEYKKRKSDICKIENKLILMKNDRVKIKRAYEQAENVLKKAIEDRSVLMEKLENNVLHGIFRGK